jgi:hypothetical protein
MTRSLGIGVALLLGGSLLGAPRPTRAGDDDLAVVKRAVRTAQAPAVEPASRADDAPAKRAATPTWLRVRIVEQGAAKRVSINVPLALRPARRLGLPRAPRAVPRAPVRGAAGAGLRAEPGRDPGRRRAGAGLDRVEDALSSPRSGREPRACPASACLAGSFRLERALLLNKDDA